MSIFRSMEDENYMENKDVWNAAFIAGDIISSLFNKKSYIIITDNNAVVVKIWEVPDLPFGLKPGDKMPEGTVSVEVLKTGMRTARVVMKDKSKFGFGYAGLGTPIFDSDKKLMGALTITSPISQQEKVNDISKEINMSIAATLNAKDETLKYTESVMETVHSLSELTIEVQNNIGIIADVINLIQKVSGQTNLLGINAAIEASRAGAEGKGFQIVAKEIRNLSETVKNTVIQLQDKLMGLKEKIGNITPQMQQLDGFVKSQTEAIDSVGTIIGNLKETADSLEKLSNESWF